MIFVKKNGFELVVDVKISLGDNASSLPRYEIKSGFRAFSEDAAGDLRLREDAPGLVVSAVGRDFNQVCAQFARELEEVDIRVRPCGDLIVVVEDT